MKIPVEEMLHGAIQTSSPEVLSRTTLPTLSPVTTVWKLAETSTLQYQQLEGKTQISTVPKKSEGSGVLIQISSLTRETATYCSCNLLPEWCGPEYQEEGQLISNAFCW